MVPVFFLENIWKNSKHYLLYSKLNRINIIYIPFSSAARHLYIYILLLALLLMTSSVCVETIPRGWDQKHGVCLICHVSIPLVFLSGPPHICHMSVGSKRQLCTKPKNTHQTFTYNNMFTLKSIVYIYFIYCSSLYILTYGYVFKIRMVIWVGKNSNLTLWKEWQWTTLGSQAHS